MGVDVRKVRWVVKDGSIFTEEEFKVKLEFKFIMAQIGIAYNVGREVANHIVGVHNTRLKISEFVEDHVRGDV